MSWLNNGSKTLVACSGIVALGAMACFKVITGDAAIGAISAIVTLYFGVNVYQNKGTPPVPPAA